MGKEISKRWNEETEMLTGVKTGPGGEHARRVRRGEFTIQATFIRRLRVISGFRFAKVAPSHPPLRVSSLLHIFHRCSPLLCERMLQLRFHLAISTTLDDRVPVILLKLHAPYDPLTD